MSIKMKQIRAFLTLASEGNLTLSADKLGLTQSGLSRLLLTLEDDLHVKLFDRHRHGLSLTEYGAALLPHALTIINTEDKARQELELISGAGKGIVRIGCVASLFVSHITEKVNLLHKNHPDIYIKMLDRIDSELFKLLLRHEIDLAICGSLSDHKGVVMRGKTKWRDRIRIIARSGHPLHGKRSLGLNDLYDYQWIMPPKGSTPMNILHEIYRLQNLPTPRPIVETTSPLAIKSFICHSDLLTSMPEPIYRLEQEYGLIKPLPIENSVFEREFYIYSHSGALTGASYKMIQLLKN